MQERISIYQRPAPFIFFVKNKGEILYIGGTTDINAKSFKYDFTFDDIEGFYYEFPDFWDEVDRQICRNNPSENKSLHSFMTIKSASEKARGIFARLGVPFKKKQFIERIKQNECFAFGGLCYFTSLDCNITIEQFCQDNGIQWTIL